MLREQPSDVTPTDHSRKVLQAPEPIKRKPDYTTAVRGHNELQLRERLLAVQFQTGPAETEVTDPHKNQNRRHPEADTPTEHQDRLSGLKVPQFLAVPSCGEPRPENKSEV